MIAHDIGHDVGDAVLVAVGGRVLATRLVDRSVLDDAGGVGDALGDHALERAEPQRARGLQQRAPTVSLAAQQPHPKMSFLRSQSARASCVGRSYCPSTYRLRGATSPPHTSRACAARRARRRACPPQVPVDAHAGLGIGAQRRQHFLARQGGTGRARVLRRVGVHGRACAHAAVAGRRRGAGLGFLLYPVGVSQRLEPLALRPIAVEEADVAGPLLEADAIDAVVASLAGGRDVLLDARGEHAERGRDAEHLEVVVLARLRGLSILVHAVTREGDERLPVGVGLGRARDRLSAARIVTARVLAARVLKDEGRPRVAEVHVQQPGRARLGDGGLLGDALVVPIRLARPERGQGGASQDGRPRGDGRRAGPRRRRRGLGPRSVARAAREQAFDRQRRRREPARVTGSRHAFDCKRVPSISRESSRTAGRSRSHRAAGTRWPTADRRGSCP